MMQGGSEEEEDDEEEGGEEIDNEVRSTPTIIPIEKAFSLLASRFLHFISFHSSSSFQFICVIIFSNLLLVDLPLFLSIL